MGSFHHSDLCIFIAKTITNPQQICKSKRMSGEERLPNPDIVTP